MNLQKVSTETVSHFEQQNAFLFIFKLFLTDNWVLLIWLHSPKSKPMN